MIGYAETGDEGDAGGCSSAGVGFVVAEPTAQSAKLETRGAAQHGLHGGKGGGGGGEAYVGPPYSLSARFLMKSAPSLRYRASFAGSIPCMHSRPKQAVATAQQAIRSDISGDVGRCRSAWFLMRGGIRQRDREGHRA